MSHLKNIYGNLAQESKAYFILHIAQSTRSNEFDCPRIDNPGHVGCWRCQPSSESSHGTTCAIVAAIPDDAQPDHVTLFGLAVDLQVLWCKQSKRLGIMNERNKVLL
jgi:hypothetical protein